MSHDERSFWDTWYGNYVSAAVGVGLTWYTYTQLSLLESGTVDSIEVWEVIAFLYEHAGFWGPIACLGLLVIYKFLRGTYLIFSD